MQSAVLRRVIDLVDPSVNTLLNCDLESLRALVAAGDERGLSQVRGHFAVIARQGSTVRLARSLARPLRYFIAKQADGPALVAATSIREIRGWLQENGLQDQFHYSYTRMAPAHYITEIELVGCPDPSPAYRRYFTPTRGDGPADVAELGRRYVTALRQGIHEWLRSVPADAPIGVCFSGGIDSGAVLLAAYDVLLNDLKSPQRLKAFTLAIDGDSPDARQAHEFLRACQLEFLHEVIDQPAATIDLDEAVRLVEDYKPLDIQAAAAGIALLRGIRAAYPQRRYLLDGDGGDENLKDYPIEENPELTIRSVLNNPLLYHEGWGVDAIKHSLTYSGGLSRACTRAFAPQRALGFCGFSPLMLPDVIAVSESIPFIELTGWDHQRLYALKGELVRAGVEAVLGVRMPIFPKRRFQHGIAATETVADLMGGDERRFRRVLSGALEG